MALAGNTLQTIRTKVRRLTLNPTGTQMSDLDIDQYINTFIAYDMPEHLRLWDLHTQLTFWLTPNVDTYPLTGLDPGDPLYNFKNLYINIEQPIYIGGYQSLYTQQTQEFYTQYPITNTIISIGKTGNGTTTSFSGFLNLQGTPGATNPSGIPVVKTPILQSLVNIPTPGTGEPNQYNMGLVLFNSVDNYNNALNMVDAPVPGPFINPFPQPQTWIPPTSWGLSSPQLVPTGLTTNGNWGILFNPTLGPSSWDGSSFINYITGQYSVTFNLNGTPTAPAVGATINSQVYPYVASRPQLMLYYDDYFQFRPVPDQAYPVTMNCYKRPTQLIAAGQVPDIEQWWQYIALGAARTLLYDRLDIDTLSKIEPYYREQEVLVLRKTIVQNTTQRTSSIYVQTNGMFGYGNGWIYNGF